MANNRPQININYRDLTILLIKDQQLHEGLWRVAINFGAITGANLPLGSDRVVPAAIVPVMGICLLRDETANPQTVDAAVVNPRSKIIRPDEDRALVLAAGSMRSDN